MVLFGIKIENILEELVELLNQHFDKNLISVVLYGSYARGNAIEGSDIDVLVVISGIPKNRKERFETVYSAVKPLIEKLNKLSVSGEIYDLSLNIKTPEEAVRYSSIYLDMTEESVIYYDAENFIQKVLDNLRKKLRVYGAKRIYCGKKWYWDIKPDCKLGEVFAL